MTNESGRCPNQIISENSTAKSHHPSLEEFFLTMDLLLFVLGYLIQVIASAVLVYKVVSVRSIYGLSLDTQLCYFFATLSRCVWTMNTRILDSHPALAVIAILELAMSVFFTVILVYLFRDLAHTTTQQVPTHLSALVILPSVFILGIIVNPASWLGFNSQSLVAFTMYAEAVALIPQLWLIRKMDDVEALTSHYIGLLVVARAVRMIFWLVLLIDGETFLCLFLADVFHTALSADYLYLWIRKLRHGGRLVYAL